MKYLVWLTCAAVLIGCAGGPAHVGESPGQPSARSIWYKVETFSGGEWPKGSPVMVKAPAGEDLTAPDAQKLVQKTLEKEGYKVTADSPIVVEYTHTVQEPSLVNIGMWISYTHQMTLRVSQNGKTIWEGRAKCPHEYKERAVTQAQLLTVLRPYFGKSSAGEKSVSMQQNDKQVLELLAP
jgi:hypothetical protein